ncbi:SCO1/SenC-domain-containing protein [Hysterangium stoloniferum]|nr:SCO1/SenC-domain-containing protein [Hysterangium stoloniferum]
MRPSSRGKALGIERPLACVSHVFTPKAAALLVAVGVGLLFYFDREKKKLQEEKEKARASVTYGRPDVGGPFQLTDQHDKPFTDKDLLGSYSLVYFGFTNCPDICPDELDKMGQVVDAVEKALPESVPLRFVQPVFVSVDPARDSVEQIRRYALDFHPRLVALTGAYDAVKSTCKAYRVYFSSPPPKEGDTSLGEDYLVDHSIYFYLMDPDGKFVQAYGKIDTAADVTQRVLDEIAKWEKGERAENRYALQVRS